MHKGRFSMIFRGRKEAIIIIGCSLWRPILGELLDTFKFAIKKTELKKNRSRFHPCMMVAFQIYALEIWSYPGIKSPSALGLKPHMQNPVQNNCQLFENKIRKSSRSGRRPPQAFKVLAFHLREFLKFFTRFQNWWFKPLQQWGFFPTTKNIFTSKNKSNLEYIQCHNHKAYSVHYLWLSTLFFGILYQHWFELHMWMAHRFSVKITKTNIVEGYGLLYYNYSVILSKGFYFGPGFVYTYFL